MATSNSIASHPGQSALDTKPVDQWATDQIKKIRRQVSAAKYRAKRQAEKSPKKPTVPRLEYRNDRERPDHRLPFVGRNQDGELSFWNVPMANIGSPDSYGAGCVIGESLAKVYALHLRTHGRDGCGILQCILFDMFGREIEDQRKGEVVGFAAFVETLLWQVMDAAHARPNGKPEDWLKLANSALSIKTLNRNR